MRLKIALYLCCCANLLAACAAPSPDFASKSGRPHPRAEAVLAPTPALGDRQVLREGIELYESGDYNGAIRVLASPEVANGRVRVRVTALKYAAFSYCVTDRAAQCQQAFEKALKLDPQFELAPGEYGHPLWGPAFAKAKARAG